MRRLNARLVHQSVSTPAPDPVSDQKSQVTWKTILGWAIGIGVALLAAIGGGNPPIDLKKGEQTAQTGVKAFHEKTGRSQVDSSWFW
jgi:hypothetical protein